MRTTLAAENSGKVEIDLYATLQSLAPEPPGTSRVADDRPVNLIVPTALNNGDTYQKTIEYFDRLAGREIAKRPVSAEVSFKPEDLNYRWIKTNLIETTCIVCHAGGTQHDFTNYLGLKSKVRVEAPEKSPLVGMLQSGGMPPYPLPSISPSMQRAVLEWIRRGAPE